MTCERRGTVDPIECVYLIGCEANTLVKIGRSVDVQERLTALRTMSPVPLALLWQTLGGAELETALHRHFEDQRSHGEWFDFPNRDAVACVTQALPEVATRIQQEQRLRLARQALQQERAEKASVEQEPVGPSSRDRARGLLAADPDMNGAELARALGLRPSGSIRTMRVKLLAELIESGAIDPPPLRIAQ